MSLRVLSNRYSQLRSLKSLLLEENKRRVTLLHPMQKASVSFRYSAQRRVLAETQNRKDAFRENANLSRESSEKKMTCPQKRIRRLVEINSVAVVVAKPLDCA